MKKDFSNTLKILIVAIVLSFGISAVYAWTGPTQAPPNGNTSAPVNIGTTAQVKNGGLGVGAFIADSAVFNGNVGIGDATPDGGLKLDIEGNVGAVQYCDENGANCTPAASLGGGGSNAYALLVGRTISCNAGNVSDSCSPMDGQASVTPLGLTVSGGINGGVTQCFVAF